MCRITIRRHQVQLGWGLDVCPVSCTFTSTHMAARYSANDAAKSGAVVQLAQQSAASALGIDLGIPRTFPRPQVGALAPPAHAAMAKGRGAAEVDYQGREVHPPSADLPATSQLLTVVVCRAKRNPRKLLPNRARNRAKSLRTPNTKSSETLRNPCELHDIFSRSCHGGTRMSFGGSRL